MSTNTKQQQSVYSVALQSYNMDTSALTAGYVYTPFRAASMYLKVAQVLPSMQGKTPSAGQKVYDYDNELYYVLTLETAGRVYSAFQQVSEGRSDEMLVNLSETRKIGFADASKFDGIRDPSKGFVAVFVNENVEIVHFIERNSATFRAIEYILTKGILEVSCGVGGFVAEVTRSFNRTSGTGSTSSYSGTTGQSSRRRQDDTSSSGIPSSRSQESLLDNFNKSSSTSPSNLVNLNDSDTPTNF